MVLWVFGLWDLVFADPEPVFCIQNSWRSLHAVFSPGSGTSKVRSRGSAVLSPPDLLSGRSVKLICSIYDVLPLRILHENMEVVPAPLPGFSLDSGGN